MAYRTTIQQCQTLVDQINKITGSPLTQWNSGAKGNEQNVGHFLLDYNSWHDRVTIARIVTPGGGLSMPIGNTHYTVQELFHVLHAYIYGLQFTKPEPPPEFIEMNRIDPDTYWPTAW